MKLKWEVTGDDDDRYWGMELFFEDRGYEGIHLGSSEVPSWVWRLWNTVNPNEQVKVKV